ncbi:hypothetical protein AB0M87_15880 [Streptomyces sp. NPDC051320]|uniref:hypothetical protein n=1 Tax=Streptomyces sp. NPDC051320 TaxID=3154644 RepID=UPI00344AE7BC
MMRKRETPGERALPELCDACGTAILSGLPLYAYVPDSSAVQAGKEWLDGLRFLAACCEEHLNALRDQYRRRPFIEEELWAGKISRALDQHPDGLTAEELGRTTGLMLPDIRSAMAWHNRWMHQETQP